MVSWLISYKKNGYMLFTDIYISFITSHVYTIIYKLFTFIIPSQTAKHQSP